MCFHFKTSDTLLSYVDNKHFQKPNFNGNRFINDKRKGQIDAFKDTPNTAGSEGVGGRTKSQTVKFIFTRIERFEIASSSIISTGPLSENSENNGDRRILLKDVVADFTLST